MVTTSAQREAYARAHSASVHVWAIEMRHGSWASPLRFVSYPVDLTLSIEAGAPVDGGTSQPFSALGFRLQEPSVSADADATLALGVDGVSGIVQPYLAAANQTATPIEVSLRAYALDDRTQAEQVALGVIHQQVRHIAINKTTVSLTLGSPNAANRKFPFIDYSPESNPGLV
tara:strand:- start:11172 stop:11690 length:519 start_codon:yes stop_codon:yes gene_type:complete